jgi:hypothetical protein
MTRRSQVGAPFAPETTRVTCETIQESSLGGGAQIILVADSLLLQFLAIAGLAVG